MSVSELFFLPSERCIFDGALRYVLNHNMDLNWIRVTMKLPILDPECRSTVRTSLPMTFQGELGISNSGHLSLWGTGRHFWKRGTPTVALDGNVSDCEVVSLPFTLPPPPHPLAVRLDVCLAGSPWLHLNALCWVLIRTNAELSPPAQTQRVRQCVAVWCHLCFSVFLSLLFRCFPSRLRFFKC